MKLNDILMIWVQEWNFIDNICATIILWKLLEIVL